MAKRALVVGINAYRDAPLRGCVNDTELMHGLLVNEFDFPADDVRVLCDGRATTAEIKRRLDWLTRDTRADDVLVFHYSGHGSQVRDRGKLDELADHKDEILCPVDLDWKDLVVTDDDLAFYFRRIAPGARLYVVLDCCHSGTGTRDLRPPGEDSNPHPVFERYLPPPFDIEARMIGRPLATRKIGAKPVEWLRARTKERNKPRGFWAWLASLFAPVPPPPPTERDGVTVCPTMNHVLVSGCESTQTSADAFIEGRYQGALTYNLCNVLRGERSMWCATKAHEAVVEGIKHGHFAQNSQLEGPEEMLKRALFT